MCRATRLVAAMATLVLTTAAVKAQSPQYNRSIERLEVVDAGGGQQRVHVQTRISATGFVVLNYDLTVLINGAPQTFPHDETYDWATGGCSTGDACSGCPASYSCIVGVPGAGCACGKWASYFTTPTTINPGAVVEAFIAPARGGDPEIDTSDDAQIMTYNGTPASWNRTIDNVSVAPASGGLHEVHYDLGLTLGNIGASADVSTDVDVLVNGQVVDTQRYEVVATPPQNGGCGIGCTTFQPCICVTIPSGQTFCYCGGFITNGNSDGVHLDPGDEIVVILRPAPGALPELPGFGDDDEAQPGSRCGDFDGDGDTDLGDFSVFALCFAGPNVPPAATCPVGVDADLDDDGDVDLSDFSQFSLCYTGPQ